MYFKEAISQRILDLCQQNHLTPNRLAELSAIAPTTFRDIISNKVNNPSSVVIYKVCKTLKIELKDFFDDDLFKNEFDD